MQDSSEQAKYLAELNRQHAMTAHERHHQTIADARKAAIEAATTAIRLMILVNGGAVVALLAFAGALETGESGSVVTMDALAAPIRWFAVGVGLSALAAAWAYFVNVLDADILGSYSHSWEHPYLHKGNVTNRLGIARAFFYWTGLLLALGSLASFFIGVFQVTDAISALGI